MNKEFPPSINPAKAIILNRANFMGNLNDYTMIEKQYIEPNDGFSQTVVVQSATYKTIYISGQIGLGTTLEAQTTAAFKI
jgi:enamine deaminase RidA (YjgF/YER057c/UK114 family)